MFETLGFETLTPRQAALVLGLALGLAFGVMAEISRFCFRRAVAGPAAERRGAAGTWLAGFAAALLGTQAAVAAGLVSFAEHRFHAAEMPVLAILAGGLMFGAGMVLARGCASRLSVLAGSGNLRAAAVLVLFAIAAHAAMKGLLAPVRSALGGVTLPVGEAASLAALPGGALLWTAALAAAALGFAARSGARPRDLALGAAIGLLVPAGWVGTGFVLYDEFDPIAQESLAFTLPAAETLFWTIAGTSVPAGFGTGLFGGVLAGAAASALAAGRFRWQGFESPRQTGRYALGAVLMGAGGVLAGGCTLGAGLSGTATLSIAALLALGAMAAGALATGRLLAAGGPGRTAALPAE